MAGRVFVRSTDTVASGASARATGADVPAWSAAQHTTNRTSRMMDLRRPGAGSARSIDRSGPGRARIGSAVPTLDLLVNNARRRVEIGAEESLLSVLRDELDLTGAKYGCGEGQCGAWPGLIDGG